MYVVTKAMHMSYQLLFMFENNLYLFMHSGLSLHNNNIIIMPIHVFCTSIEYQHDIEQNISIDGAISTSQTAQSNT